MRECNAQTKPITVLKVIEPLYVKNTLRKQRKNKEIMFSKSINEKLSVLGVKNMGII